jgi:hypothetical protein
MLSSEKCQQTSRGRYSIYDASVPYYATVKFKSYWYLILNTSLILRNKPLKTLKLIEIIPEELKTHFIYTDWLFMILLHMQMDPYL